VRLLFGGLRTRPYRSRRYHGASDGGECLVIRRTSCALRQSSGDASRCPFQPSTSTGDNPMSAFDAVDSARPAVLKCYSSCVESESNRGGETTANLGAEALKELARTRRRNADKVDPGIGKTRLGQRIFECVFLIGTRSAQSIVASGFTAAQTGRTHDRTRPMLQLGQKVAAVRLSVTCGTTLSQILIYFGIPASSSARGKPEAARVHQAFRCTLKCLISISVRGTTVASIRSLKQMQFRMFGRPDQRCERDH
jgi:hypothetical protein